MNMLRKIFTREDVGQETAPDETIHREASAFASQSAELSVARETAIDGAMVEEMLRMIANVGTGLWRMRQKMINPGTNEPHEEMRRIYRNFESVWDSIDQAGVEIQDHTGNLYESGTTLRVIALQPTADVEREIVIETLKPTIYFKGRQIQPGEVVVATPDINA